MPENSSKHQIQKLSFNVGYDTEENAYQFQADFSAFIKDEILPLKEAIMDKYGKNKQIRINKLELDLGDLVYDTYKEDFYRIFKEKFADKLHLLLSGYNSGSADEIPEIISLSQSQQQILLYFFQTGILPWNVRNTESPGYVNRQLLEFIELNPAKARLLIKEVLETSDLRLRFIRQVNEEVFWKAIQLHYGSDIDWIKKEVEGIIRFYLKNTFTRLTQSEFRESVLSFIIEKLIQKKVTQQIEPKESGIFSESFLQFIADKLHISIVSLLQEILTVAGMKVETVNGKIIVKKIGDTITSGINELPVLVKAITEIIESDEKVKETLVTKKSASVQKDVASSNDNNKNALQNTIELSKNVPGENRLAGIQEEQQQRQQDFFQTLFSGSGALQQQQSYINTLILQRISAIVSLLKKYFNLPAEYKEGTAERIETKVIENYVKEIISFNPSLLKKIFQDSLHFQLQSPGQTVELKFYVNQQLLLELEESTRIIVLRQVFSIEENTFVELVNATEKLFVKKFFTEGIFPEELLKKYNTKRKQSTFLEKYLKDQSLTDDIIQMIKQLSGENKIYLLGRWSKHLEAAIIDNYFSELLSDTVIQKKKKEDDKITIAYLNAIKIESFSFESLIILLQDSIRQEKTSKISQPSDVLSKLVKLISTVYETKAEVYFSKLSEKEYKRIQPALPSGIAEQVKRLRQIEEDEIKSSKRIAGEEIEKVAVEKKKIEEIAEKIREVKAKKEEETTTKNEPAQPPVNMGDPIYINNSGIVILHPYLSMLFKRFELLNKKEFKDEYSMHKAVHLLQYLANKSEKAEEHELVLNKIICGMDLSVPLQREIVLTEEEKNVCESLLEAVIQNWGVLKKTSPDNLRRTFFIREGRLLLEPQGWKLRVEEKGYDILVEKLPWAIGMVRFPWMKNIIYVEWK